MRDDRNNFGIISLFYARFDFGFVKDLRDFIHQEQQLWHIQLAGHFNRDASALVILLVWSQDNDENIGNSYGEESLFVQSRMGIDDEHIQFQLIHQSLEAIVQQAHVVSLAQHPCNFARFDAGGDQVNLAFHTWAKLSRDIVGSILNLTLAPQVIVERVTHFVFIQAKEDVDARRLYIGIDNPNAQPLLAQ